MTATELTQAFSSPKCCVVLGTPNLFREGVGEILQPILVILSFRVSLGSMTDTRDIMYKEHNAYC